MIKKMKHAIANLLKNKQDNNLPHIEKTYSPQKFIQTKIKKKVKSPDPFPTADTFVSKSGINHITSARKLANQQGGRYTNYKLKGSKFINSNSLYTS